MNIHRAADAQDKRAYRLEQLQIKARAFADEARVFMEDFDGTSPEVCKALENALIGETDGAADPEDGPTEAQWLSANTLYAMADALKELREEHE